MSFNKNSDVLSFFTIQDDNKIANNCLGWNILVIFPNPSLAKPQIMLTIQLASPLGKEVANVGQIKQHDTTQLDNLSLF